MRCSLLLAILFSFFASWSQSDLFISRLSQIERDIPFWSDASTEIEAHRILSIYQTKSDDALHVFLSNEERLKALFIENGLPAELRFFCLASVDGLPKETPYFSISKDVAKSYGLEVDKYLDQRKDLMRSADAFVKQIEKIDQGKKSLLTTALLVTSEAERDTGIYLCDSVVSSYAYVDCLSTDLANLYRSFVAHSYLLSYATDLGLLTQSSDRQMIEVQVLKYATLYQLSRNLSVPVKELKRLNPIYIKAIIPGDEGTFFLTIPKEKYTEWNTKGEAMYRYPSITKTYTATEVKILERTIVKTDTMTTYQPTSVNLEIGAEDSTLTDVTYSVRSGDILLKIADLFDCEVVQLKRWNGLSNGDDIDIDQQLIIKVPPARRAYYQKIDLMSNEQRKAVISKD